MHTHTHTPVILCVIDSLRSRARSDNQMVYCVYSATIVYSDVHGMCVRSFAHCTPAGSPLLSHLDASLRSQYSFGYGPGRNCMYGIVVYLQNAIKATRKIHMWSFVRVSAIQS